MEYSQTLVYTSTNQGRHIWWCAKRYQFCDADTDGKLDKKKIYTDEYNNNF